MKPKAKPIKKPRKRLALFDAAMKVRSKSYSRYSRFKVGAALVDKKGRIFTGCNVENSSYGATSCAERSAIAAMVSAGGYGFTELLVVTDTPEGCPPCGICRQVLTEFASNLQKVKIHIATTEGQIKTTTLDKLLPEAFGRSHLEN